MLLGCQKEQHEILLSIFTLRLLGFQNNGEKLTLEYIHSPQLSSVFINVVRSSASHHELHQFYPKDTIFFWLGLFNN